MSPEAVYSFKALPFSEAEAVWRAKVPTSKAQFKELSAEARERAFFISGLANLDQAQTVRDALGEAMAKGEGLAGFKNRVGDLLAEQGFSDWRIETIWRTNVQGTYMAGRYAQMMTTAASRPWWRYSAVMDSATRPSHRALHGLIFRHDHEFWNAFYPPNGFNCRCAVQTLSDRQLAAEGLSAETEIPELIEPVDPATGERLPPIRPRPDAGFARNAAKDFWKPELAKYSADLKQAFLERLIDGLCPDEFADANRPGCLVRLKRHLVQADLEDLETLIWSRTQGGVEGFGEWVSNTLANGQAKGELHPVALLPAGVLEKLKKMEAAPRLALIVMDDNGLLHMVREAKASRGAALSAEELAGISEGMQSGRWWWDQEAENILATWIRQGDSWLKIVVRLDQKLSKNLVAVNRIVTSGVVFEANITKDKRYVEL